MENSKFQTNKSFYCLTGLKVCMQIKIVIWGEWWQTGQWVTTSFLTVLSRKTVRRILSESAGNECLFNIFPSWCKVWVHHQVLSNQTKCPLTKQKGIKYCFFLLMIDFIYTILYTLSYHRNQVIHLGSIGCDLFFVCFAVNLITSSWHRDQNKPYLRSPSPPHRCETQMFSSHQTKPQLYPTQYEWWYF